MATLVGSDGAVVWMVAVLVVLMGGLGVALLAATRMTRRP
jgi:hypothetical protein